MRRRRRFMRDGNLADNVSGNVECRTNPPTAKTRATNPSCHKIPLRQKPSLRQNLRIDKTKIQHEGGPEGSMSYGVSSQGVPQGGVVSVTQHRPPRWSVRWSVHQSQYTATDRPTVYTGRHAALIRVIAAFSVSRSLVDLNINANEGQHR